MGVGVREGQKKKGRKEKREIRRRRGGKRKKNQFVLSYLRFPPYVLWLRITKT